MKLMPMVFFAALGVLGVAMMAVAQSLLTGSAVLIGGGTTPTADTIALNNGGTIEFRDHGNIDVLGSDKDLVLSATRDVKLESADDINLYSYDDIFQNALYGHVGTISQGFYGATNEFDWQANDYFNVNSNAINASSGTTGLVSETEISAVVFGELGLDFDALHLGVIEEGEIDGMLEDTQAAVVSLNGDALLATLEADGEAMSVETAVICTQEGNIILQLGE